MSGSFLLLRFVTSVAIAMGLVILSPQTAHGEERVAQSIPRGSHVEHTGKWAWFGTGLGVFAGPYSITIWVVAVTPRPDTGSWLLLIPGAGPLAALGWYYSEGSGSSALALGLALDATLQVAGLSMLVYSLTVPSSRIVRDGDVDVRLLPTGPLGTPGLSLGGTF